jgi:outer membrane protein
MKKIFILVLTFISVYTNQANAQAVKFGYVNTQELIAQLPQVKIANDTIQAFKVRLGKKMDDMVSALRLKAMNLEKRKNETAPIQYEKEVNILKEEEKKIGEFEQLGQKELAAKSEGLLSPIQMKINDAIKAVAAEEKYTYIFDEAQGIILYADATANVTDKVKAKLK